MKEEKPFDIYDRVLQYAVRAVRLSSVLAKHKEQGARTIGRQFLRSATSVGANIEEAKSAQSRADFVHKFTLSQKEARESHYWLKLLAATGLVKPNLLTELLKETDELISVITRIIVSTKNNDLGASQ